MVKERLISARCLRGTHNFINEFVNNPGDWDMFLRSVTHFEWNGCTPTAFSFSIFYFFIIGVVVPLW